MCFATGDDESAACAGVRRIGALLPPSRNTMFA
jgi:hypothetical protein